MTQAEKPARRGRKPVTIDMPATPAIDHEAVAADLTAPAELAVVTAQHESAVRAVAERMGYQLPADCADPDLIQRDIAANMRRSVEACLEVGRGLCVLKTACGHGNFIERLDALGIEARLAQRFMASAVKFSNTASTPLLQAAGNQTKLFELLVLDDEQIEELTLTGQTGELALDDVACMGVKELRTALRQLKADAETKGKLLAEKTAKIGELADKLTKRESRIAVTLPDEMAAEIRSELLAHAVDIEAGLNNRLKPAFAAYVSHWIANGGKLDEYVAATLDQLERVITEIRDEFGIPRNGDGEGMPAWAGE